MSKKTEEPKPAATQDILPMKPDQPPPNPRVKKITMNLSCDFTQSERADLGRELGEQHALRQRIEEDKTAKMADFKAQTAEVEAKITSLSNKVTSGRETRDVECEVTLDDPKPNKKTIRRLDTLAIVKEQDMDSTEKQRELPLTPAAEAPAEPAEKDEDEHGNPIPE